jgi:hypothetical protein
MRYQSLPLIAAGLLLAAAVQVTAAQLVPTPRATLIPASVTNRPFLAAASTLSPVDLATSGYAEDELFASGQGSILQWAVAGARDAVSARSPKLPWITRVLVRRPLDTRRFSGRVIVELLDARDRHDVAPLWGLSQEQFLRNGDVWVGVTVSLGAIATLNRFDPLRYELLAAASSQAATCRSATAAESGLAWDMIAQVGALLRSTSRENPLRSYSLRRVILAGYATGGGYVVTYANAMHAMQRLGGGEPVYDGYLGAAVIEAALLDPCADALSAADPRRAFLPRDVPVIVVRTQSERGSDLHRIDSDDRGNIYRFYEIAGAAQSGPFPAGQPIDVDLQIAGVTPRPENVCREPLSDFPAGLAFNAIWRQLDRHLVAGEPMISVPPIETDSRGEPRLDRQGNVLGGWRLPQIDVPLAAYAGKSTPRQNDAVTRATCELTGSMRRYDTARLKTLYKDRDSYIEKFNAAVDLAVELGTLVSEDGAALKAPVVRTLPAF